MESSRTFAVWNKRENKITDIWTASIYQNRYILNESKIEIMAYANESQMLLLDKTNTKVESAKQSISIHRRQKKSIIP